MNPIRRVFVTAVALVVAASALVAGQAPEAQAAAYLEQLWRSSGTPAISVAVASKGRIVYSAGFGFADLDNLVPASGSTVYNIGSVSKVITAVAIMQLVEKGKVGLDDAIQKYVPAFPEKSQTPITIRHVMTHTSGIRLIAAPISRTPMTTRTRDLHRGKKVSMKRIPAGRQR